MAYIDPDSGELTLRIVYDGPPSAGKTTNVRVLHETLFSARGGSLESPGSSGRVTQFFDWRTLDAGYLDGRPLRVHVLSVPGQWSLRARRRLLLRSADAVCFVADASAARMAQQALMVASLRHTVPDLDSKLVLQVNKVDLPDAVAPALLTAALGLPPGTPTVSARAQDNIGVSETFLAVSRLATASLQAQRTQHSPDAPYASSPPPAMFAQTPEELQEQILTLESAPWHTRDDGSDTDWSDPV